jgi:hypothetical protein
MYKINKDSKTIEKIEEVTFKEMNVFERSDIQQWIKNDPCVLGENLLIIQEEFDKFEGTNERPDLLALDKSGNLVVIENKRDESGKDVHWQAIKYASYFSTIKRDQLISIFQDYLKKNNKTEDAEDLINTFLENDTINYPTNTQRIILVARDFSKEVLSASQWLLNNHIDITCVQIKPYKIDNTYLLDSEVILPQGELKEYLLGLADKEQNQKEIQKTINTRLDLLQGFWTEFWHKKEKELKNTAFQNINSWTTRRDNWMSATTKFCSKVSYQFIVSKNKTTAELYIATDDKLFNKKLYDFYVEHKDEIEQKIGNNTEWNRGDEYLYSRISIISNDYSVYHKDDWECMFDFFIDSLNKLQKAFDSIKIKDL